MKKYRAWIAAGLFAAALGATGAARAQSVQSPHLVAGDSWTFIYTVENRTGWHQTRTESVVVRASATSVAVENKQVGSTMPPVELMLGADWSRSRSVNGHETLVNRPLAFPLSVGQTWSVEYTEDHPNRAHSSERFHSPFRVTGWEDVTVPAGTFHALKIESEGDWSAAIAPAVSAVSGARVDSQGSTSVVQTNRITPTTVSGRTYKAFWYAPEVKRWVKSVEEYYDGNGRRNERYADELESFKVGG